MKIRELLDTEKFKSRSNVIARQDETVGSAVSKLIEHNIGSLPVCDDNDCPLGIITERDIIRKSLNRETEIGHMLVGDIMSKNLVIATMDDDVDYAINAMKQEKIRHLPLIDDIKVVGIISMRDLLGIQLEQANYRIRLLDDYITGGLA
ncbi:MAG: CBS domain-containing protein [Dehalococcoidales bacterium]|nr:MAG: CBS domain-containing protein [Dehalococcoidales bacterium]